MKNTTIIILLTYALTVSVSTAKEKHSKESQSAILNTLKLNQLETLKYCKQDLAQKLDIEQTSIKFIKYEDIVWSNGALGCPTLGKQYTQGQVPGLLIVLAVDDLKYSYHASNDGVPFYCPRPNYNKPTPLYQDK